MGVLFSVSAFAQSPKPGLWETTSQMFGEDPAEVKQRANLSPAERKKTEDFLSKSMGTTVTIVGGHLITVEKECATPEEAKTHVFTPKALAESSAKEMTKEEDGCTVSNISQQPGNTATVSYACPASKTKGSIKVTVHNDTSSSVHWQGVIDGRNFEAKSSSRWLSTDCGNVKPDSKKDE